MIDRMKGSLDRKTVTPYPGPRTRADLMEELVALAPDGLTRGLFAITGGQATDLALRMARRATGRDEIIAFRGGYFGRDLGVLGVNAKPVFRRGLRVPPAEHFFPFPYPYRCAFGNRHPGPHECGREAVTFLEDALRDPAAGIGDVAAILVEPVQGNGGVVIPPPSLLSRLSAVLTDHPQGSDVRGVGLFIGIEMVTNRETRGPTPDLPAAMLRCARDAGLILGLSGHVGNAVKLAPPLIITRQQPGDESGHRTRSGP